MLQDFNPEDFRQPTAKCDLIMEGGVTSGVVYPRALLQLAKRYEFASIGGTSAGAIAAALAAAAEFGRAQGGFVELQKLPNELARILLSLFQPTPKMRGVFNAFLATMRNPTLLGKIAGVAWSLIRSHWSATLIGLLPALIYPWDRANTLIAIVHNGLGALIILLSVTISIAVAAILSLQRNLPKTFFGICPGLRQPSHSEPALTNWLTDQIDKMAGRRPPGSPRHLTFGELKAKGIKLQMMTTNLSMHRPYRLPFAPTGKGDDPEYAFNEDELTELFPDTIVDQMATRPVDGDKGYFYFPEPDDLPVVVATRLSLSFPVLLSAIPLYRKDRTLKQRPDEIDKLRRCTFSDGGISSDFPIQFFDSLLPTRPTFAISLTEYDPLRNGDDLPINRVFMPKTAREGIHLPIKPITSLLGFAGAILTSARVWQDTLQSVLPGYRERIAHVALDKEEGGLNLNMPRDRIERLTEYGDIAGQRMLEFDFDEHRWRRFLATFDGLQDAFNSLDQAFTQPAAPNDSFKDFLARYPEHAQSYDQTQKWLAHARAAMTALDAFIQTDIANAPRAVFPRPVSTLRTTPDP